MVYEHLGKKEVIKDQHALTKKFVSDKNRGDSGCENISTLCSSN